MFLATIAMDLGTRREQQDCILVGQDIEQEASMREPRSIRIASSTSVFAICDGMGGHRGGAQASRLACRLLRTLPIFPIAGPEGGARVVRDLQHRMMAESEDGSGTTLAAMWADGDRAMICHVGDSRIYHLVAGRAECLTNDHSLVQRLIDQGMLTRDQAAGDPRKHVLEFGLGRVFAKTWRDGSLAVGAVEVPFGADDAFLVCSDGFSNVVTPAELGLIARSRPATGLRAVMRRVAKSARDNVSVCIVERIAEPPAVDRTP